MNEIPRAFLVLLTLSMASVAVAQEATPASEAKDGPAAESGEVVTDAWISTKVKADLLATDDVAGTDMDVDTANGVVILTGTVCTRAEADKGVSVARGIEGLSQVVSKLSVAAKMGATAPGFAHEHLDP